MENVWLPLAGCQCPWCYGVYMYHLEARVAHFPWSVRVGLGLLGRDVGMMEGVWAGIQMPNSEIPGALFHVFQGVPLRPGLDPKRQARDVLGALLLHEVDEGLELEGARVYKPHGKDDQLLSNPLRIIFAGGTI